MRCELCGSKKAKTHETSRTYGKGKSLLLVEGVPVISCSHCGESYMDAETLHEIERIKLHSRTLSHKRPVAVVSFG